MGPLKQGFFLHVRVLSRLFGRLFIDGLMALHQTGQLAFFSDLAKLMDADAFIAWLAPFRKAEWVVYTKPPFGGPEAVPAYLSRQPPRSFLPERFLRAGHSQYQPIPSAMTHVEKPSSLLFAADYTKGRFADLGWLMTHIWRST